MQKCPSNCGYCTSKTSGMASHLRANPTHQSSKGRGGKVWKGDRQIAGKKK